VQVSTPDAAAAANGNLLAGNIVNAANANAGAGPAAALIIAALPANALAHAANPNNLQPAAAAAAALAAQAAAVALVGGPLPLLSLWGWRGCRGLYTISAGLATGTLATLSHALLSLPAICAERAVDAEAVCVV
jgi:hypothetical protein